MSKNEVDIVTKLHRVLFETGSDKDFTFGSMYILPILREARETIVTMRETREKDRTMVFEMQRKLDAIEKSNGIYVREEHATARRLAQEILDKQAELENSKERLKEILGVDFELREIEEEKDGNNN